MDREQQCFTVALLAASLPVCVFSNQELPSADYQVIAPDRQDERSLVSEIEIVARQNKSFLARLPKLRWTW
ncbi:hypothetical protein AWB74_03328 [Caballeronia arvi]|uniref:Uncharacterized protein n=1 Tax=Caballeronia arvi TaxID=1777135 RepID=A0A158J2T6_9BURK|nr:hypothetical protein AWB74_03328 [Caballeronia arvi]